MTTTFATSTTTTTTTAISEVKPLSFSSSSSSSLSSATRKHHQSNNNNHHQHRLRMTTTTTAGDIRCDEELHNENKNNNNTNEQEDDEDGEENALQSLPRTTTAGNSTIIVVLLQFWQPSSSPYAAAYIYPENTLDDLRNAIRSAFASFIASSQQQRRVVRLECTVHRKIIRHANHEREEEEESFLLFLEPTTSTTTTTHQSNYNANVPKMNNPESSSSSWSGDVRLGTLLQSNDVLVIRCVPPLKTRRILKWWKQRKRKQKQQPQPQNNRTRMEDSNHCNPIILYEDISRRSTTSSQPPVVGTTRRNNILLLPSSPELSSSTRSLPNLSLVTTDFSSLPTPPPPLHVRSQSTSAVVYHHQQQPQQQDLASPSSSSRLEQVPPPLDPLSQRRSQSAITTTTTTSTTAMHGTHAMTQNYHHDHSRVAINDTNHYPILAWAAPISTNYHYHQHQQNHQEEEEEEYKPLPVSPDNMHSSNNHNLPLSPSAAATTNVASNYVAVTPVVLPSDHEHIVEEQVFLKYDDNQDKEEEEEEDDADNHPTHLNQDKSISNHDDQQVVTATLVTTIAEQVEELHSVNFSNTTTTSSLSSTSTAIRQVFLCPLLLCLMADPVTAEDGYTYERTAIERYFVTQMSPSLERQESAVTEPSNQNNNNEDDDDDDDATSTASSVPPPPSTLNSAFSAGTEPFIVRSPVTRDYMSTHLVPNRLIEGMIVDAVQTSAVTLSAQDWQDWQERRQAKRQRDRQKRAQEYHHQQSTSMSSSVTLAWQESSRHSQISMSSSGAAANTTAAAAVESMTSSPNHRTTNASISQRAMVRRMIQWDRRDEHDRFGPNDTGLSVLLAHGNATATMSTEEALLLYHTLCIDGQLYCAVGCCIQRLSNLGNGQEETGIAASSSAEVGVGCPRCLRRVCESCRVAQVTDLRDGGGLAKPYSICLDCVLQITDVMAQDNDDNNHSCNTEDWMRTERQRILRGPVMTRLQTVVNEILLADKQRMHREILRKTRVASLLGKITKLGEDFSKMVGQNDLFKNWLEHFCSVANRKREEFIDDGMTPDSLISLGCYAEDHNPPFDLRFPCLTMDHFITVLRERLPIESETKRDSLTAEALQMEARLSSVCDKLRLVKSPNAAVDENLHAHLDELKKEFDDVQLVDTASDYTPAGWEALINDEVCDFAPDHDGKEEADEQSQDNGGSSILRMCPYCRTGPMDRLPITACPNCGHRTSEDGTNFEEWPEWDGVAGPH